MAYNLPTNTSGAVDLWVWSNNLLDGKFGVGIIFLIFISLFLLLYQLGNKADEAFVSSMFITFILSTLLMGIGVLSSSIVLLLLILTTLTLIVKAMG